MEQGGIREVVHGGGKLEKVPSSSSWRVEKQKARELAIEQAPSNDIIQEAPSASRRASWVPSLTVRNTALALFQKTSSALRDKLPADGRQ